MTKKEEFYFKEQAVKMHRGISSIRLVDAPLEAVEMNGIKTGAYVTVQVYVSLPERTLNRRFNKTKKQEQGRCCAC